MRACFGIWFLFIASGCFGPFSLPDERREAADQPQQNSLLAPAAMKNTEDKRLEPREEAPDALTCAAECMERGDQTGALPHLRSHLRKYPEAIMIRTHLAELLFRLDRTGEARPLFEQVILETQGKAGAAAKQLVHCHTRLMEIADREDDRYEKYLNRGIGLFLLVERWDQEGDSDETLREQTLTKAAAALREAVELRANDARANLYFGEVAERMGQRSVAQSSLRAARAGLPDPSVTAYERERIEKAIASQ